MPLLHFTTAIDATDREWRAFAESVAASYADHMETGTDHVAVARTRADRADLWLGRGVPGAMAFLEADVREGRSADRRRRFALAVMDDLAARWGVPEPNMKVVFTEHEGSSMMGYDRVGDDWSPASDDEEEED